MIADDLTGALDSGVRLASKGAHVVVTHDWRHAKSYATAGVDVLVVDTESRHVSAPVAYERVCAVASEATCMGVDGIYKKCDSGLRGNIGAELSALLDVSAARRLDFVPAYPALGRTTVGGVHFVDGIPLAQSVFASDPLEAMTRSSVADIIHEKSDVHVSAAAGATGATEGVVVHDCASDVELAQIGAKLASRGIPRLAAGCAGLLGTYELRTRSAVRGKDKPLGLSPRLAVVSGSLNSVCQAQLDYAARAGAVRAHMPLAQLLAGTWTDGEARSFVAQAAEGAKGASCLIIDSLGPREGTVPALDDPSRLIAQALGSVACALAPSLEWTLMVIGGDTLMGFFEGCGIASVEPVREVAPGVVLARYQTGTGWRHIITKSGAFGAPDLIQTVLLSLSRN